MHNPKNPLILDLEKISPSPLWNQLAVFKTSKVKSTVFTETEITLSKPAEREITLSKPADQLKPKRVENTNTSLLAFAEYR